MYEQNRWENYCPNVDQALAEFVADRNGQIDTWTDNALSQIARWTDHLGSYYISILLPDDNNPVVRLNAAASRVYTARQRSQLFNHRPMLYPTPLTGDRIRPDLSIVATHLETVLTDHHDYHNVYKDTTVAGKFLVQYFDRISDIPLNPPPSRI